MKTRMTQLLASILVPGILLFAAPGNAAEINKRTIKLGYQAGKDHPQGLGSQKFADIVAEKSGGKITVKSFPNGTLGGDVATISSMQGGTIEMSVMNAGLLSSLVKDFVVVDFPFLFNTPQEADAVMDGPVGKALSDQLPEKGLVGLGYWELGFRNLTNSRRPVTKLEDIQGLKIRVLQSPIFIDLFTALGANAVPLPYPELYTAMETGTVDGQENPFSNIISSKFYEVQKNLALTQHVYNPQILLISKKFWDKLNSDEQKVLQDAAIEARDYQRTVSREMSAKALDEFKTEGVRITELPPEEVEKLRAKTKPVVEKHSKEVNPALVQQLYAEIDKVRGKN